MESKNIYQKIIEAKEKIGAIEKNNTNPFFKSKYFDINTLLSVVEQPLIDAGLIVLQPIIEGYVCTQIVDTSTLKVLESKIELSDQKDPQKLGSEITYYRRYTLQSLLSLQAEDDDGNKAIPKPQKEELHLNTMAFSKVKDFLKGGGDIERPKQKYTISKEVENALYKD